MQKIIKVGKIVINKTVDVLRTLILRIVVFIYKLERKIVVV